MPEKEQKEVLVVYANIGDSVCGEDIKTVLLAGYTIKEDSLDSNTEFKIKRGLYKDKIILCYYHKYCGKPGSDYHIRIFLKPSVYSIEDLVSSGKRFFITKLPSLTEKNNKYFDLNYEHKPFDFAGNGRKNFEKTWKTPKKRNFKK